MARATVLSVIGVVTIWLISGNWAKAKVDHMVGGDRGWDPSYDLTSWSSSRIFTIGDYVWFSYSRAEGKIAELKTKEEYDSCDVTNPINMYSDGLNTVKLDEEGIRYFVSTNSDHCNNGLKLHVKVVPTDAMPSDSPKLITSESAALSFADAAAGPTPSGSAPALSINCITIIFSVAAFFYTLESLLLITLRIQLLSFLY